MLAEEGGVVVWGEAEDGKLGVADNRTQYHRIPQLVDTGGGGGVKVVQLAAGSKHSLLLTGGLVSTGGWVG